MDPKIAFGRPVVRDIWVPTETLFDAYQAEGGAQEAAEEFGVRPEDVANAVNFERDIRTRMLH
jgi:uncharacterized protein (DUF433 family)